MSFSMQATITTCFRMFCLIILLSNALHVVGRTNHVRGNARFTSPTNISKVSIEHVPRISTNESSNRTMTSLNCTYHGGKVISNVNVVLILWGGSKVRYAKELRKFYSAVITRSSWYNLLREYSTPTQSIGYGSLHYVYSFDRAPTGILTPAIIAANLKSLIGSGQVPFPDPNIYYAIHFAPGTSPDVFFVYDCGWHSFTMIGQQTAYYGVIPDQDSCALGCGTGLGALLSTTSHELAEVITDPTGDGWIDSTLRVEIGDLCWDNGTTVGSDGKVYVVQKLWSNSAGKCISGFFPLPSIRNPTKQPSPTKKN